MQIDLLVNSFVNDMARVATLQFTKSVGGARMNWLDIKEGHHALSHEDKDEAVAAKLVKINQWFAGELAYLVQKLASTPEPGGEGMMLDNTLIVWTNELGRGSSHTLDNIPFLLVGGAPGLLDGPLAQVGQGRAQPPAPRPRARHGPPPRNLRQSLPLRRRAAEADGGLTRRQF